MLDVCIVGAGLGGLATAIASANAGHRVTVFERAPELVEIGAGLQLGPNSSRILIEFGLGPELEECWAEPVEYALHRYSDGKLLHLTAGWDVKMRKQYGAPFIDVHRGRLQQLMYRRALALGVNIILGAAVTSIDPTTAAITLASGQIRKGDLVVGCDGLWSVCRESLLGHNSVPEPTGDLAYRILLSIDQVSDERLKEMIRKPACRLWIGPHSHVVAYSLGSGTQFNIVLLVPDNLPPNVSRQPGNLEEMKALFQDWDPTLNRFLHYVDGVQKWKLMHITELETWKNEQGNFILLGDSCHPMLPYLAQGASSAIEDGAVLGKILEKVTSRSQLRQATACWQEARKARSEFIVRESAAQRDAFHMPNGPGQEARDLVFEKYLHKEPADGFPSRWVDPQIQSYIFGYNAFEEGSTAARKLDSG